MSFGAPPAPGQQLLPGNCWQTVIFQHGVDPAFEMNTGTAMNNTDTYCSLESLMFAMDAADSGPYEIYVDSIMQGTNVVEDFEGYAVDTQQTFVAPNAAPLPSPASYYFPGAPNSSLVSGNNKYDGTNSCRIQWQWADNSGVRWARVMANAASGKHLPQIKVSEPITVNYLVLPVGVSTGSKFTGTVSAITNTTPIYQGGSVTMGVTVTGAGPFTYAWSYYDPSVPGWSPLPDTTRTCTVNPLPAATTSQYSVKVTDPGCYVERFITLTTPVALPIITNQPASIVVGVGSPANTCVGATPTDPLGGANQYYQWEKRVEDGFGTNWNYVVSSLTAICLSEGIPTAQLTDTGFYRVIVQGLNGPVISRTISLQVVDTTGGVVIGNGNGLRGDYFNLATWPNTIGAAFANNPSWAGTPVATRVDSDVNFVWSFDSPAAGVNPEKFGVRWYGQIQPLSSDTYTFDLYCGDGARLWIDKVLVINSWSNQYATSHSAPVVLSNTKHDILLEYFESTEAATAQLYWNDSGAVISNYFVPVQQLFANKATWVPPTVTLTAPASVSCPRQSICRPPSSPTTAS